MGFIFNDRAYNKFRGTDARVGRVLVEGVLQQLLQAPNVAEGRSQQEPNRLRVPPALRRILGLRLVGNLQGIYDGLERLTSHG